jgi:hydroxycarboxylate dehydrogenase B
LDSDGEHTVDPNALYRNPPGVIMPFGGTQAHRGYALGLLVEALATLLAADSVDDPNRIGNNVSVIAITAGPDFRSQCERLSEYVCSAAPIDPAFPVLLPGDPEVRARSSVKYVDFGEQVWRQVIELGREKGLDWALGAEVGI